MIARWAALVTVSAAISPLAAQQPSAPGYRVGVTSESGDIVSWFRPDSAGVLTLERVVSVDPRPPEVDGPHNITVAPDHRSYYVSLAHGTPWGSLWRLDARTHKVLGTAPAEGYPTTIAITPDGEFAFVANSDFFGDRPRVNPVTIIHTPTMTTITQLEACDMPHGARANRAGTVVWISCMHSDELLAIDVTRLAITHRVRVGAGHAAAAGADAHAAHTSGVADQGRACAPTFVALSRDDARLYVACNARGTLQVWDAHHHTLIAEVVTGSGAYNVEPSPDGRWVVVTNKKDRSVSIIDAARLVEVRRVPTTKAVVHGIAFAPDGRHAFITQESVGADPGAVDTIDLHTLTVTSTIAVPTQPTGITILRMP